MGYVVAPLYKSLKQESYNNIMHSNFLFVIACND